MADSKHGIIEDIKSSSKAILGVIAFVSAVATILIDAFGFEKQITILTTIALALLFIGSTVFMSRIEHRTNSILEKHIEESSNTFSEINNSLKDLKEMTAEVRKDTLRIQLREYIKNEPSNIDTILTIANEYFGVHHGNWIAHHEFLDWVEKNNVHVPNNILDTINNGDHSNGKKSH